MLSSPEHLHMPSIYDLVEPQANFPNLPFRYSRRDERIKREVLQTGGSANNKDEKKRMEEMTSNKKKMMCCTWCPGLAIPFMLLSE